MKRSADATPAHAISNFGSRDATHQQVCVPVLRGRYFPYLGNSVHGMRSCSGYLSWRVLVPLSGSLDEPDGCRSLPGSVFDAKCFDAHCEDLRRTFVGPTVRIYYDTVVAACRNAGFEPRLDASASGSIVWGNIARARGVSRKAGALHHRVRPRRRIGHRGALPAGRVAAEVLRLILRLR